jgi:hypothetical protein
MFVFMALLTTIMTGPALNLIERTGNLSKGNNKDRR